MKLNQIKSYIDTHDNRKEIIQDIYNTLIQDWYCESDARLEAKQSYEMQIAETLDA